MTDMQIATRKEHPAAAFIALLNSRDDQLFDALPSTITVKQFKSVAILAVTQKASVYKCSTQSLYAACLRAAHDGLLPDGREGAIVPYGENEDGRRSADQAVWMPMIAGLRKKAFQSKLITTWEVAIVRANDVFAFELGDDPRIIHRPALDNPGDIIAAYSIATLAEGGKSREVMSIQEVEAVRSKSKAQKGPWSDPVFYGEMVKKTVARRHAKVLPLSTDLVLTINRDDQNFGFDPDAVGREARRPVGRPRNVIHALEAFASPKAIEEPAKKPRGKAAGASAETIDAETGEVTETNGQASGKAVAWPKTAGEYVAFVKGWTANDMDPNDVRDWFASEEQRDLRKTLALDGDTFNKAQAIVNARADGGA